MSRGRALLVTTTNCILASTALLLLLLISAAAAASSSNQPSIAPRRSVAAFRPSLLLLQHQPRHRLGLITRQHQQQEPAQQHHHIQQRRRPFPSPAAPALKAVVADDAGDAQSSKGSPLLRLQRSLMAARGGASNGGGKKDASLWNLPNILTLMRVFAIPVLVGIFYKDVPWRNLACTVLFVFAAMTDWLDGYLARRMNLSSPLGAFLDPVADKLMVATALVLMADRMRSPLVTISTAIIINREIGVSALREWMASMNQRDTVAVGWWGKVKTATQMVALSILLYVQPPFPASLDPVAGKRLLDAGVALLAFSAFLTVTSAAGYMQAAWPVLTGKAKN